MLTSIANNLSQRGVVLLSVVSILLSLATLSIWVSSQRMTGEMRMLNSRFAYQHAYANLNEKMEDIAQQLKIADDDAQLQARYPQSDIQRQTFTARNNTVVYRYNIHLTAASPSINIYRSYLRYSGLFSLPDSGITENDEGITSQLLNRSIHVLSPMDFDIRQTIQGCKEKFTRAVVWIEGDCDIGNSQTLGSADAPILLIVKNGDLTLGWNSTFYGLVILVETAGHAKRLTVKHNSKLIGALVSNHSLTRQIKGKVEFDLRLLQQLQISAAVHRIVPIRGSWHDFK